MWESQLYRPLYALVETWQFGAHHNEDPIKLIKKGNREMFRFVLVWLCGLGLLSTIPLFPGRSQSEAPTTLIAFAGTAAVALSIAFLLDYATDIYKPVRKFIRSMIALDKILLEVGRGGIAPLPQEKHDIVKELRDTLVWEARLKLEAEGRDKYGEDVKKHDSRFRRLVEAIGNMGFEIEPWDSYYNEAKAMLEPKTTGSPVVKQQAVTA